jgi:hypothetical protein
MQEVVFMYANLNKNEKNISVYAESCDLCYTCAFIDKCPLISAVQDEAVVLRYESLEVATCPMFKECTIEDILALDF